MAWWGWGLHIWHFIWVVGVIVKRIRVFGVSVVMAFLGGCILPLESYTQAIGKDDVLPNGTVGEIQANPKRSANATEIAAIQRAVRTNPLLSGEQVVSNVRVEAVSKPALGFCGRLSEGVDASGNEAVVTGVLKTVEGRLLAYDLRYGDQAQLRCSYMQFWPDTKQ